MLNDSIVAIQEQLRDGVTKGYWTLESIDRPSSGWVANTKTDVRTFPEGYQGLKHRNLLRDHTPEKVQATQDPRDFAADQGSDIRRSDPSLQLPRRDPPDLGYIDPELRHEGFREAEDCGDQAPLGTKGEPAARFGGMPPEW